MLVIPLAIVSCTGDNIPTAPDGGSTTTPSGWFWQNPLPQGNYLWAVHFANATTGTTEVLRGVSFADSTTGTAVGDDGVILRTTDGGSSWMHQLDTDGSTWDLQSVSMIDANTGTAVGECWNHLSNYYGWSPLVGACSMR